MAEAETRPSSAPVIVTVAPYGEVTPRGAIFGGWLLAQVDHAAGLAGRKVAGGDALILSIKELTFHGPLHAGEEFVMHADVTRRGRTSFNLSLSCWAEPDTVCRKIMSADVVMVAVDEAGKPRELPSL